jgi:hypothetical protein
VAGAEKKQLKDRADSFDMLRALAKEVAAVFAANPRLGTRPSTKAAVSELVQLTESLPSGTSAGTAVDAQKIRQKFLDTLVRVAEQVTAEISKQQAVPINMSDILIKPSAVPGGKGVTFQDTLNAMEKALGTLNATSKKNPIKPLQDQLKAAQEEAKKLNEELKILKSQTVPGTVPQVKSGMDFKGPTTPTSTATNISFEGVTINFTPTGNIQVDARELWQEFVRLGNRGMIDFNRRNA